MPTIKLLSIIEATTVTGPAKVLLEFYQSARQTQLSVDEAPPVNASIVTFNRAAGGASKRQLNDGSGSSQEPAPNHFVQVARAAGLHVDVVPERFRFDTRVIHDLRRIIEQYKPHIIETHHVKSHFLLRASGLWKQRPWVAYHHGYTMTDSRMKLYNQLDRWSLPAANRIITVSRAAAQDLERMGVPTSHISALHNAISPDWHKGVTPAEVGALRQRLGIAEDERVVLAVGRLSKEKAHLDLVAALGHLKRSHPDLKVKFVIVGDGPERPNVESAAQALGVQDRLILTGQANDVRAYYALADLMALPSLTEGSPIALLEAMAAAVPVVATRAGGIPEIVTHHESALLVEVSDAPAMANAIALLLQDKSLAHKLTTNARAAILSRHTPESNLRARLEIYRALVPQLMAVNA